MGLTGRIGSPAASVPPRRRRPWMLSHRRRCYRRERRQIDKIREMEREMVAQARANYATASLNCSTRSGEPHARCAPICGGAETWARSVEAEVRRLLIVKTMAWRRFSGINIAAPEHPRRSAQFKAEHSTLKCPDVTKHVETAA
jgi:hypothetical protein